MKYEQTEERQGVFSDNTFRIRMAISATLFFLVVFFDMTESFFMGIGAESLYQAISFDFEKIIELAAALADSK